MYQNIQDIDNSSQFYPYSNGKSNTLDTHVGLAPTPQSLAQLRKGALHQLSALTSVRHQRIFNSVEVESNTSVKQDLIMVIHI